MKTTIKNNKKHFIIQLILITLMIIMDGIMIFLLPDKIPAHFGPDGSPDRYGSKWELFIMPAVSVLLVIMVLFTAKSASNKESSSHNNDKLIMISGECTISIMFIINIIMAYLGMSGVSDKNLYVFGFEKIICIAFGIMMIVMGNIMPKAKMNGIIGFRCSWSMKDENTWSLCQHFSGITMIITGILTIIEAFFFTGNTVLFIMLAIIFIALIVCLAYAYKASHKKS